MGNWMDSIPISSSAIAMLMLWPGHMYLYLIFRKMLNIQRSNYLLILTIISDKTNNVMRLDLSCLVNLLPNSFICGNKLWHNLNGDYIHMWKIPLNGYFGEYWNPLSLGFLHSSPIFWIRYHKKVLYHFIT